jgi:uncharacterized protein YcbK (DUF882 family)
LRSPTAPLSIGSTVGLAIGLLLCLALVLPPVPATSREPDKTLKLYFGHTGEHGVFTFKRNGRYDRRQLERINHFLRDWRKEETIRMDPQLLDLVWAIYRESGSHDEIHVVSAYRSPATNAMLRRRSKGVAKHSQHMLGKAMDWYVTDVPLAKLRAIAMKMQGGGVGYYPTSGSPFIHTDTGNVRAWPRMTRKQLVALFPNGETLHLPSDGKPLPGYQRALAESKASGGKTTLAYLETEPEDKSSGSDDGNGVGVWLRRVFPGEGDGETATSDTPTSEPSPSSETQLAATTDGDLDSRMPRARPSSELEVATAEATALPDDTSDATLAFAPLPRTRPDPVFLAASLGETQATDEALPVGGDAIAALASASDEPLPASGAAAGDPIEIAFAALEQSPALPSEEDRAVIAAFAAMRARTSSGDGHVLAAADDRIVVAMADDEPRPVSIAAASQSPLPSADAAAETGTGGPAAGIVLAPDNLPRYRTDQDALRGLITTPASYDPQFAHLEMPAPAANAAIYQAPDGAEAISGLSNEPSPPVNRFAATARAAEPPAEEQGFFVRLFASLIE